MLKCYICSIALHGAETGTLRAVDQKHLERFEMWCWRRMEISWTDRVRNEVVLLRVKEQRNILHEESKRNANWIGHILRINCLLQQVIKVKMKGRIEVTGRRGRRRRKLLDDLKERKGYCHLKEEVLDRTVCRAGFGSGFRSVVRLSTKWNETTLFSGQFKIYIYIYMSRVSYADTRTVLFFGKLVPVFSVWYDIIWHGIWYDIYDMIYLLTAIRWDTRWQ
jgi:hypothetical protein